MAFIWDTYAYSEHTNKLLLKENPKLIRRELKKLMAIEKQLVDTN